MLQRCRAGHTRRLSLATLVTALALGAVPASSQPRDAAADALLAIDLNRSTVIDRIVMQWGGLVLPSGTVLDAEQLRTRLSRLRADRLLAASLAGTPQGLQRVLNQAQAATPGKPHLKSLGDTASDLTYTPLTPCRIIDTRNAVGPLQPGVTRTEAGYTPTTFAAQGGATSNCGIPAGVAALALNVVAVNPTNLGFIKLWPANAAEPNASTINYDPTTTNIATGTIVPVDGANNNSFDAASPAQVQMVVDVVGYFAAPSGNGGKFFLQGGNALGVTAVLGTLDNNAVNIEVNSLPTLRMTPMSDVNNNSGINVVNGLPENSVDAGSIGATISGGGLFRKFDNALFANHVAGNFGTIGGGISNTVGAESGTVGGGQNNDAADGWATLGGGANNVAGLTATVAGGSNNTASGTGSTIGGGGANIASGFQSTVPGGFLNAATANYTFAAGHRAKATTTGSFMWADSQDFDFQPSVPNFFGVRATGGVGLTVGINPSTGAVTEFCNLLPAVNPSWACTSDRDVKENFIPADGKDILRRLIAMPVFSWNMKGGDPAIRSLGPTAQDFYEAFALGKNDKTIASLNLEGVALAAIQGLNQIVREKDARIESQEHAIAEQQREIADLRDRIHRVESLRGELDGLKRALSQLMAGDGRVAMRGTP